MKQSIAQSIAKLIRERPDGGPGIVFVDRKAEARWLSEALSSELGAPIPWVTSDLDRAARQAVADLMRSGAVAGVVATSAWSTGIDIPCLRWIMLTGRTSAPIGVLQSAGRGTRPSAGKQSFDIINIAQSGDDAAAIRRAEILTDEGFEREDDESFLDAAETGPQPAGPSWVWSVIGPGWFWKGWAVAFGICVVLHAFDLLP